MKVTNYLELEIFGILEGTSKGIKLKGEKKNPFLIGKGTWWCFTNSLTWQ